MTHEWQKVRLDKRHGIAREFTGAPGNGTAWVVRFCGDWVTSRRTRREAREAARFFEYHRRNGTLCNPVAGTVRA